MGKLWSRMDRRAYAEMFGPTVGDRCVLPTPSCGIEIERELHDLRRRGEFGGGKVIRDGMGQGQANVPTSRQTPSSPTR